MVEEENMEIGIAKAESTYRLPNPTTPEDLGCRTGVQVNYGDFVIFTSWYWQGPGKPDTFAAIYETLDPEGLYSERTIGLHTATEVIFEDTGHAIEWAINYIKDL